MSDDPEPADSLDPERYDRWFEQPWGRHAFAVERDALLDALGPLDGRELVEVGCGTGRFTAALQRAGAEVTGVDNDPGMLARAASRTDTTLVLADAHTLPLSDDTFDVAVAITLLEFAADPQRIVNELVRVTRPGGRIAVATLNPRSPWALAHRRELRNPPWNSACLTTRPQLRGLLAEHGRPRLHGTLHAPGLIPGFTGLARVAEHAGRWAPGIGAFQIAVLDLPEPARPKSRAGERKMALDPATVAALGDHRRHQLEARMRAGPAWQESHTDWQDLERRGLVWTYGDGSPIHPKTFYARFLRHARAAGLPRIRLHDVRHSYASAALAAATGWHDVKVISQRLGHSSVAITLDTYSHVLPAADETIANTLADVILGTG